MPLVNKILDDLVQAAIAAKTHFQMLWAQKHTAMLQPDLRRTMNTHSEFFLASQDAHFKAIFVDFALIFDKRKDVSSASNYLRLTKDSMPKAEWAALNNEYIVLRQRVKPVVQVRHDAIAHVSAELTEKDVFERLGFTWDEIRAAVDDAATFVTHLAGHQSAGQLGIPRDKRLEEATLRLLATLKIGDEALKKIP